MIARRDVLTGAAAAAAVSICGAVGTPTLGLLAPVESLVPPEAGILYPRGIRFLNASLGLARMTPDGYDQVLDRIAPMAEALAQRGATAITLMGTSLSFYKGAAFNRELTQRVASASGCP